MQDGKLAGDVVDIEPGPRSTYKVTTARSITAYLGNCDRCHRPVRADLEEDHGKMTVVRCPDCDGELAAERLVAVITTQECDASCRGAYGKDCTCACGGVNHAKLWAVRIKSDELPESLVREQLAALVKYYDNKIAVLQRLEDKQAEESRLRAVAFNEWIGRGDHEALVFAVIASEDPKLAVMKARIDNNEIPSDVDIRIARYALLTAGAYE